MPVVPIRKQDSAGKGFSPRKPVELPADQEPWALMAAAQMDHEGRLMEPTADSALGIAAGTRDLDALMKAPR
jgi:hypothetical protein